MKLSEAAVAQRVVVVDNTFADEVRWVHYERREGVAVFTTNPNKPTAFVPACRLRVVQGVPGQKPRYDTGEIRIQTEVDGRLVVVPAEGVNHDAWESVPKEAEGDEGEAWLIFFEDAEMSPEVFMGHGAAHASRHRFEQLKSNWNCHLFKKIETG